MCDFSGRLVAWRDGELADGEAAIVEQHVDVCSECRRRLDAYEKMSGMVNAYCDATLASAERGGRSRWVPLGAAVGVAVTAMMLLFVHLRGGRLTAPSPAAVVNTASVVAAPAIIRGNAGNVHAAVSRKDRKRSAVLRAPDRDTSQNASQLPAEPAIQIAIPGDAIFPPGAIPDGFEFVADVTIAPDGTAQRLRLQPELTEFQGGTNR